MTTPGGVVLGLLGVGVVYLVVKGKEKSDQLDAMDAVDQPQPGPPPSRGLPQPSTAPGAPPSYGVPIGVPRSPFPRPAPHFGAPPPYAQPPYLQPAQPAYPPAPRYEQAPAYPPPPAYPHAPLPPPARQGVPQVGPEAPWVRATQQDVRRDGVTQWYLELLNSSHPAGYSEQRSVGGHRWKLTVVSAATHPQLTQRGRDVLGWILHGGGHPAPPAPHPHAYPPAPAGSPYPPPPPNGQAPHAHADSSSFAPPSWQHPHDPSHKHHPHPPVPSAGPAPAGDCRSWHPATDADVHQDGVATVYQSMLSLPESSPARVEVHKGRVWKFQVVTPASDPSFGFAPGVTKSVRGWVCMDAPAASDPGY